jgi:hypothetical protein
MKSAVARVVADSTAKRKALVLPTNSAALARIWDRQQERADHRDERGRDRRDQQEKEGLAKAGLCHDEPLDPQTQKMSLRQ